MHPVDISAAPNVDAAEGNAGTNNRTVPVTLSAASGRAVSFAYDAVGNRVQMADGGGTQTYAYDAGDRLVGVGGSSDQPGSGRSTFSGSEWLPTTRCALS